jgi:hypothetical protein
MTAVIKKRNFRFSVKDFLNPARLGFISSSIIDSDVNYNTDRPLFLRMNKSPETIFIQKKTEDESRMNRK